MNKRKAKAIRKMVSALDAKILLAVRNEYGEKTNEMDKFHLYKAAKRLYKRGLLQI